jgi:hypothetical protein
MSKKKGIVYGIGINDADYVVSNCLYYRKWKQMMRRCYSPNFHIKNQSYVGCSVCEEWHRFSNFKSWMMQQDWEGKELDKDILFPGNKVYSPDKCVFIDKKVNELFSKKNKYGVRGVVYCERLKKYIVRGSTVMDSEKKSRHYGCYSTLEEAKKVSDQMRKEYVMSVANEQKDDRVKSSILSLIELKKR